MMLIILSLYTDCAKNCCNWPSPITPNPACCRIKRCTSAFWLNPVSDTGKADASGTAFCASGTGAIGCSLLHAANTNKTAKAGANFNFIMISKQTNNA
jgi:hypothetical protein